MKKLLLIIFFVLITTSAHAKDLYVNHVNGNDSTTFANNDAAHPWATIKRAAWGSTICSSKNSSEAAHAGDTVNIAAGTYSVNRDCASSRATPTYNPANSGSSGNLITFKAIGTVILTQTGNTGPIIGADAKSYIVWDGFYIDEANITTQSDTGPVAIFSGNYITIQNCTIIGTGMSNWPDNHKGIAIQGVSSYITIKNNKIANFYTYGVSGHNGCGIQIYNSAYFTIENNEIYNVGAGIYIKEGRAYGYGNSVVRNNLIYNASEGAGIIYSNDPPISPTGEIKIYRNLIRDSDVGVQFLANATGEANAPSYGNIVNNTIDNCRLGVTLNWTSYMLGNVVWNNIITNSREEAVFVYSGDSDTHLAEKTHIDYEHNLYFGFSNFSEVDYTNKSLSTWKTNYHQDSAIPASLNVNPQYVDRTNHNFRLCTANGVPSGCTGASPARNAGIDILDLNSNGSTTDSINIGAYITGYEVIGVARHVPYLNP
jgi:hypothetical protein